MSNVTLQRPLRSRLLQRDGQLKNGGDRGHERGEHVECDPVLRVRHQKPQMPESKSNRLVVHRSVHVPITLQQRHHLHLVYISISKSFQIPFFPLHGE